MTTGPGYPSTPVVVFANSFAQILPPPDASKAGPVPPDLRWVVLVNSSPFTLLVQHGTVQGELAAFTADLFQVDQGLDAVPITILPQAPQVTAGGGILAVQDQTVYATWYEAPPGGTYPSAIGAGSVQFLPNQLITFNNSVPVGTTLFPSSGFFTNIAQFQAIELTFIDQSGLPITSWTITLLWVDQTGLIVAQEYFTLALSNSLMAIRPVFGAGLQIIVTGTGGGGAMSGHLNVQGLATYGGKAFALPQGDNLVDSGVINVAAGATVALGTSIALYGGPAHTTFNAGGNGTPWQLFYDVFNETTGAYDPKWNINSTDLPTSPAGAQGPTRWWLDHIIDHARPFRWRVHNGNAAASNMQLVTTVNDR